MRKPGIQKCKARAGRQIATLFERAASRRFFLRLVAPICTVIASVVVRAAPHLFSAYALDDMLALAQEAIASARLWT
jgi:hypothetical protein